MPLPAALAARLEKRGLLNSVGQKRDREKDKSEEVIAEDDGDRKRRALLAVKTAESAEPPPVMGYPGCPNKCNVYHECSVFCNIYWSSGILEPDKSYIRKKKRMLSKYPLPDHWKEEYDPGTGRFFYWDQQTNLVSWLPPSHPKAKVSEAASVLRERNKPNAYSSNKMNIGEDLHGISQKDDSSEGSSDSDDLSEEDDDEDEEMLDNDGETQQITELQTSSKYSIVNRRHAGKPVRKNNDLDPMDPAAYSDIPRGTWSSGLEQPDSAKTGVDSTATGPLFQQRPYPSPGAVLRANASKQ